MYIVTNIKITWQFIFKVNILPLWC